MQAGVPPHYGAIGGGHGSMTISMFLVAAVVFFGGLFALVKLFDVLSWLLKKISRW
jgi:hypothetical protein